MFKDKEFRKGIIASIVASLIFLIFLQPILEFIWNLIVRISLKTYSGYIDHIYKMAALGQRNSLGYITLLFLISFAIILLFSFLLGFRKKLNSVSEHYKIETFDKTEDKEKYLEDKMNKLDRQIAPLIRHSKKITIFLYVYQFLVFLFFCDVLFKGYADLQLNTSFNQRVNAIAPHINDQQEKELRSKWALMKNRLDFENLNKYLEDLAISKNIILPENLLK